MTPLTPSRLAALASLHRHCAYGVTPPLKVIASDLGVKTHGSVIRFLLALRDLGLVEQVLGCWRPTKQGIDLIQNNTQQGA
ncbi:MAG: hypothetical protein Q8M31_21745 [Beijerinckiaceae bacterium]|nr:hypothetical protein [Beijerinckiaceae bacterium]